MMRIIAECRSKLMAIEDNAEISELTKCRVYDTHTGTLAPELLIGSWSARVFPWIEPTKDYKEELAIIEAIIKAENDQASDGCNL